MATECEAECEADRVAIALPSEICSRALYERTEFPGKRFTQPDEPSGRGYLVSGRLGQSIPLTDYADRVNWNDGPSPGAPTLRTRAGETFQRGVNSGKYFAGCAYYNKSKVAVERKYEEYGGAKLIENIDYSFKLNLDLPVPRVPYQEPDPCLNQRGTGTGWMGQQNQHQWQGQQRNGGNSGNQNQRGQHTQNQWSNSQGNGMNTNQGQNRWSNQQGQTQNQARNNGQVQQLSLYQDAHSAVLDSRNDVLLYWLSDPRDNESMIFEAHVRTRGWLGIGFSPNGAMAGADMVVGWIDNSGTPHIKDMYAEQNGAPQQGEQQDYELLSGTKNATHTIIQFKRKLQTCDEKDWTLTSDTTRIIWAYDDEMPSESLGNVRFAKHRSSHRSSKSVHLMDVKQTDDGATDTFQGTTTTMEFKAGNVAIPGDFHTLYWCQVFKMPDARQVGKHHLIKYEPIIQAGHEAYVHHMILYACSTDMEKQVGKPEPCFDRNGENFSPMYQCTSTYIAGWAVGGEVHKFPENVGYPMFDDPSEKYFMLEMHYDNSGYHKNLIDNSGMRLYITPNLQPIEAGTLTFGVPVGPMYQILPPGQKRFTNYGYCTTSCTKNLPKDGVNVYAGLLHTHLSGKEVRIRHIRNGKELKPLLEDNYYDFNYQEMANKNKPTKIYPGDEFIVECVYDTSKRRETTFGGFSTKEEMCLAYVEFYPRVEGSFSFCASLPDPQESLGVLGAEKVNGELQVIENDRGENVSIKQWVMQNVDWDANRAGQRYGNVEKFQDTIRDGKHWVLCLSRKTAEELEAREAAAEDIQIDPDEGDMDKSLWNMEYLQQDGMPTITEPYSPPDVCHKNRDMSNRRVAGSLRDTRGGNGGAAAFSMATLVSALCASLFHII